MKANFRLPLLSLFGLCTLVSVPAAPAASDRPLPSTRSDQAPSASEAPSLSRAEERQLIADAKRYVAHPSKDSNEVISKPKVTMPDFDIAEPPPAPRSETKPEAPGPGYVWVDGHYMPVKGQWRWVRGEWAVPALPISVWIPARYDEKEKTWAPGYWQPDVPAAVPAPEAAKDGKPAAPTNGY